MANAQLKLSRRALLGAVCAAPLSRHPGLDPGPMNTALVEPDAAAFVDSGLRRNDDWTRALTRLRRAEAAVLALEGGPDEDAFGRAQDRFNILFRRLLAHPAPDVAAVADKLEIAAAAELADLTYAPPGLTALVEDARRLASS